MGDTISALGLFKQDSNDECNSYLNQLSSIISSQGTFLKSAETDLTNLTYFNLTRDPNT